ncbi:hypothetical protein CGCVW01_v003526 [Colletotrichum viniferum]|nr:hypothetical protein CGCVW01_v003526 [Colletotrichum viniferum]
MHCKPAIAVAILLQLNMPALAELVFYGGAPADGSCPAGKGETRKCEYVCSSCSHCYGSNAPDLGATYRLQDDGTYNVFCYRTGENNCKT